MPLKDCISSLIADLTLQDTESLVMKDKNFFILINNTGSHSAHWSLVSLYTFHVFPC